MTHYKTVESLHAAPGDRIIIGDGTADETIDVNADTTVRVERPAVDLPTGLGAVVEGKHGDRFVHADPSDPASWFQIGWDWQRTDVVEEALNKGGRVLSHGLHPGSPTPADEQERPEWGDVAAARDVERARATAARLEQELARAETALAEIRKITARVQALPIPFAAADLKAVHEIVRQYDEGTR